MSVVNVETKPDICRKCAPKPQPLLTGTVSYAPGQQNSTAQDILIREYLVTFPRSVAAFESFELFTNYIEGLVIEEEMRFQYAKNLAFLDATQEESVIGHDAPTLERIHRTLMRWSITGRDDRDAYAVFVFRVELLVFFLDGLNLGYPYHEFLQRPRVVGLHDVLHFMGMKHCQPRGLHDRFRLIAGEYDVKVECDAQGFVSFVVLEF